MFAYIKGILQQKETAGSAAHRIVLECHGFGLEMQVSQQTLFNLPQLGEEIQIHTVFVIKETEYQLFGFSTLEEKELFNLLTSVSGVGPKLALALLGTLSPAQLSTAIIDEEERLITQAPGIGAKVAGRIILELKTKIKDWQEKNMVDTKLNQAASFKYSIVDEEVRTILVALGYSQTEITDTLSIIKKEKKEITDVEGLVKESLKILGAGSIVN